MINYYVPNIFGSSGVNSFQFNQIPTFTTWSKVPYSPVFKNTELWPWDSEDVGFGDSPDQLAGAAKKASEKGDSTWAKIINNVLFYGEKVLTVLSNTGVIQNKNLSQIYNGTFDYDRAKQLLDANNGDLNPQTVRTNSAETNIFGLNISTLIILGIGIYLYSIYKNK